MSGVILSADFTGLRLLIKLPPIAITIVVIMIAGVGLNLSKPPPKIIFAMLFVIVMLSELKIAMIMPARIIPPTEESDVRIRVSLINRRRTNFFSAPIARIVPISLVRSITETIIVFIMIMNTTIARIIIRILNIRLIPATDCE